MSKIRVDKGIDLARYTGADIRAVVKMKKAEGVEQERIDEVLHHLAKATDRHKGYGEKNRIECSWFARRLAYYSLKALFPGMVKHKTRIEQRRN